MFRIFFYITFLILASIYTAHGQRALRMTLGTGGSSRSVLINAAFYQVQQSIGQSSVTGTFSKNGQTLRQGFIQPYHVWSAGKGESELLQAAIFPNPFQDRLHISLPQETHALVRLYDLQGRLLISEEIQHQREFIINTAHMASGSYLLKLQDNKRLRIIKLIRI